MKRFLLFGLIFLSSFTLSAQCFDYQSEIQNIENFITAAQRNLKKARKAATLEQAQQFVDKSITQAEIAIKTAPFAKEYALSCDCEPGVSSVKNILAAISDFKMQCQKLVDSGSIEELQEALKDNLLLGESVLNELSEAFSICQIIPEIENSSLDSTQNN
jgi:hypothetical protein